MRKFIVQQWVTVDNIAAEEDGGMSFVAAQPFAVSTDENFKASAMEFIDTVDTMILGANTYAMSKDYCLIPKTRGRLVKSSIGLQSSSPQRSYVTLLRVPSLPQP
jgi:hypothetical protein